MLTVEVFILDAWWRLLANTNIKLQMRECRKYFSRSYWRIQVKCSHRCLRKSSEIQDEKATVVTPVIRNKCFSSDNIWSYLAFLWQPGCIISHRGPESVCFQVRDGWKHSWDFLSLTKWFATFLVFFIFMTLPLPHWFILRLGHPRGPLLILTFHLRLKVRWNRRKHPPPLKRTHIRRRPRFHPEDCP